MRARSPIAQNEDRPHPLRDKIVHWIGGRVRRRWQREWERYDHTPKLAFWPRTRRQTGNQVFRSLIQVNFYRRSDG